VAESSAELQGLVIDPAESVDFVYVRTRYQDGTLHPPIDERGVYHEGGNLGWATAVTWNGSGVGTFEGRARWLDSGTNHIDIYLPGGVLGSPAYTQPIVSQPAGVQPYDVVAGIHPTRRTVDVTTASGNTSAIEFLVDLINTTQAQAYSIDLRATMELPDGTLLQLPMGGPGKPSANYTVAPGDYSYTSVVDPVGMTFSFPLDQAPFPQPTQLGAYHMEVQVYDGAALLFEDEDIDFWVVDRSGKPFRDVTDLTGLDQVRFQGGNQPSAGNSIAAFDHDRDGLTDLFFSNPSGNTTYLPIGPSTPYPGGRNYLMQNRGDGTFQDVTLAAGVAGTPAIASYGVAYGDLDDDGFDELVVCNRSARPYVYKNRGDGSFTEVSKGSFGPLATSVWHEVPRLGDWDDDGDLDLYLGNYLKQWDYAWQSTGWGNRLYRNELVEGVSDPFEAGFPAFTLLPPASGANSSGLTLAAFFWDADRDGSLDIAVHNDFGGFVKSNKLFMGDGTGAFTDQSSPRGYDVREWSMGALAADLDGDGDLDSYSTNMGRNSLLVNDGSGHFAQGIEGTGSEGDLLSLGPHADGLNLDNNWSVLGFDHDKDGDVDLYVTGSDLFTGNQLPIADIHPDSFYENLGALAFQQRAGELGLNEAGRGRGAVLLDYDGDGDLDVVVSNENECVRLYRNDFVTANHHLAVRPVTSRSAPGGFNTFLRATAGGSEQVHELLASSMDGGQIEGVHWFGLGSATQATVVAEWTRGGSTTWFSLPADTEQVLHETVIEVNGAIDGTAQVGKPASLRLFGRPGAVVVAFFELVPGAFPLPGGGVTDVIPVLDLLHVAQLDASGESLWSLGAMPASASGKSYPVQMVEFDLATFTVPAKSGVSVLSVTP
jgi:hypothetical protein